MSKIPWTEKTWNPVIGCTKCSPGCLNCYAERMACRIAGKERLYFDEVREYAPAGSSFGYKYDKVIKDGKWNGQVFCDEAVLEKPLHWRNPRKIFVCSMSDLFHPKVPFEFSYKVLDIIYRCPQHTFQVLTKRIERFAEQFTNKKPLPRKHYRIPGLLSLNEIPWPLPNLHLGVSVSTQKEADEKIPILLKIPAAVRYVSLEPLLEEINLGNVRGEPDGNNKGWQGKEGGYPYLNCLTGREYTVLVGNDTEYKIDWVIIGAESKGSRPGRECKLEWVRDIVEQCQAAGVAPFVKQLHIAGKLEKDMKKFSPWARFQEYPKGGE